MDKTRWLVLLVIFLVASVALFIQLDTISRLLPLIPTPTAVMETCYENIAVVMTGTSESGVTKPVKINVRVAVPCGK